MTVKRKIDASESPIMIPTKYHTMLRNIRKATGLPIKRQVEQILDKGIQPFAQPFIDSGAITQSIISTNKVFVYQYEKNGNFETHAVKATTRELADMKTKLECPDALKNTIKVTSL